VSALKSESAADATRLLDRAIEELFSISETVERETPEEHLGYVGTITPALDGAFSMLRVIREALPELTPREEGPVEQVEYQDIAPSDDSYRWANSMTEATAKKVASAIRDVALLLQEATDLLASTATPEEVTSLEIPHRRAREVLAFILERLESQHPGVTTSA
jgi:hypothetical protein